MKEMKVKVNRVQGWKNKSKKNKNEKCGPEVARTRDLLLGRPGLYPLCYLRHCGRSAFSDGNQSDFYFRFRSLKKKKKKKKSLFVD